MDNLYLKGELLQIETKNCETFEGRFYSITTDKSKISLYDVKELPQGDQNEGVCHYYDTEVRSIVKIKEKHQQNYLKISQKDYEELVKISKRYIYINQVDSNYHKAMVDLKEYSYLGLSTDGASMGRKCKMPFLVMSTPQQIYIFDIQVMLHHAFNDGLKAILEDDNIKKIVHDSRKISDCLYHKHNVKLKSVFDTQVGDLIITKNKNGCLPKTVRNLNMCLNTYLGLPLNSIDEKFNILQCTERPLQTSIKDQLAKNIVFHHRLSEIINDEMMLPFVRGVECYLENLRSSDEFKAWELCGKCNILPKEFKSAIDY